MALLNMVRQTITAIASSGTGQLTLGPAVTGYRTMAAAGAVDSRWYSYSIIEGAKFETGLGQYTSTGALFTRTLVRSSSNSGSAEAFTTSAVFIIASAREDFDLQTLDAGTWSTGTFTFDISRTSVFVIRNGGAHTWAFANTPDSYWQAMIMVQNLGAYAVTLPTINWVKGDGTYTTNPATLGITLRSDGGWNQIAIWTFGGSTLWGRLS